MRGPMASARSRAGTLSRRRPAGRSRNVRHLASGRPRCRPAPGSGAPAAASPASVGVTRRVVSGSAAARPAPPPGRHRAWLSAEAETPSTSAGARGKLRSWATRAKAARSGRGATGTPLLSICSAWTVDASSAYPAGTRSHLHAVGRPRPFDPNSGHQDITMKTRKLGTQGLEVSRHRPRLHGHWARVYGPAAGQRPTRFKVLARGGRAAASPSSTPPRSTAPTTNEVLVGEGLKPFRDQRGDRHQVRLRHRRGRRSSAGRRGTEQPPRAHPRGGRGLAEAAGRRRDRPVLPAPRRPERADRGRGRRGQATSIAGGQGQALRPVGSRPRDHPPRPRRAAGQRRCRANIPCGSRDPERTTLPVLPRTGHRLGALQPAGPRLPDRARSRPTRRWPRPTSAAAMPRFQGEALAKNLGLVETLTAIAAEKGAHARRSWPWPGSSAQRR